MCEQSGHLMSFAAKGRKLPPNNGQVKLTYSLSLSQNKLDRGYDG